MYDYKLIYLTNFFSIMIFYLFVITHKHHLVAERENDFSSSSITLIIKMKQATNSICVCLIFSGHWKWWACIHSSLHIRIYARKIKIISISYHLFIITMEWVLFAFIIYYPPKQRFFCKTYLLQKLRFFSIIWKASLYLANII